MASYSSCASCDALRVIYRADGGFSQWTLDLLPRGAERRASGTAAPPVASARNLLCDLGAHAERPRWRSARVPPVSWLKEVARYARPGRCALRRLPPPQATSTIRAAGTARRRYAMGR